MPIGILRGLAGAPLGARTTSILPSSIGNRDGEDFGLLVLKNGRVCPTNYEQRQAHDYIDFPSLSKERISSKAAEFYASGLSLRQISQHLNKSKTFIRKTLLEAGVSLRLSVKSHRSESSAPPKLHSGNTPFGYRNLRGRLIMDAREIEIVHSIMEFWTRGKSYSAIAAHLNGLGLKNRRATRLENIHSCAP